MPDLAGDLETGGFGESGGTEERIGWNLSPEVIESNRLEPLEEGTYPPRVIESNRLEPLEEVIEPNRVEPLEQGGTS